MAATTTKDLEKGEQWRDKHTGKTFEVVARVCDDRGGLIVVSRQVGWGVIE